jgi:lysozyme
VRGIALLLLCASCGGVEPGELVQAATYTSECPDGGLVEGIDVASGQGMPDWAQVKGSGRAFAFVKATQGDYYTSPDFAYDWMNTKANGLLRSAYHFFDPTIDGVKQANHFLSVAGPFAAGDLPPMLDIECPISSDPAVANGAGGKNCEHMADSGWVPTDRLAAGINDWLATVEAATGRKPIIYSYPSWFQDVGFTDAQLAQYPLFIATLNPTCAKVPAPWTQATFWQYTFSSVVPGIHGACDGDRFIGTLPGLMMFASGPSGSDGGAPDLGHASGGPDAAPDGGSVGHSHHGCACDVGGPARPPWLAIALLLLAVGVIRSSAATRQ